MFLDKNNIILFTEFLQVSPAALNPCILNVAIDKEPGHCVFAVLLAIIIIYKYGISRMNIEQN